MTREELSRRQELSSKATASAQVCRDGRGDGQPCEECRLLRDQARAFAEEALRQWWDQDCEEVPPEEEELRQLLAANTSKRPWRVGTSALCRQPESEGNRNLYSDDQCDVTGPCGHLSTEDAALAAGAVNALARLLMKLRAHRAQVDRAQAMILSLERELAELPGRGAPLDTRAVLEAIAQERARQDAKWGTRRDFPDGTGGDPARSLASLLRDACDGAAHEGKTTWMDIFGEEVGEALAEAEPGPLRKELLQVAAVCAVWIEALDRRAGIAVPATEASPG